MSTPVSTVEIARHTYDCFEVVAWDLFGRVIARRMYCFGKRRREWAFRQAREWADRHYLRFDDSPAGIRFHYFD